MRQKELHVFDTTRDDLKAILRQVRKGELQLPDFQRDYVWNEEDVRSLIASIAKGFPIGALLTLETGGPVAFKPRLLAGVPQVDIQPEQLLLDGQQRMTSLYQSLFSPDPVRTRTPKGKEIDRYYYLDVDALMREGLDFDEALIGVPKDRILRTNFGKTVTLDLSSEDNEFEQSMFPLNKAFDSHGWLFGWRDYQKARGQDVADLHRDLYQQIIEPIDDYKMPIIRLDKKNSREAICLVFEKVNVGGKKLTAFELLTAIYAADKFDLREDWRGVKDPPKRGRKEKIIGTPQRDVLTKIASTDFLQACTLLHTREVRLGKVAEGLQGKDLPQVSCNKAALLALPLSAHEAYRDAVENGFVEAGRFLNGLSIIWHKDVPYPPTIVALAATFAILGKDAKNKTATEKLEQWFWSITLGELYGSSTESRLAKDIPSLVLWVRGEGGRPQSLDEALFQRDRLLTLRSRLSAAYKGVNALLMKEGCRDFISNKGVDVMTFFNDDIDIHHVFPQKWCKDNDIPAATYNSIVNKTPLSKLSNILIGGDAPSVYLQKIQDKYDISATVLDEILRTHLIEPAHLRSDDFDAFFEARLDALVPLISKAMGKPVVMEAGSNEQEYEPTALWDEAEEVDAEEVA